MRKSILSSTLIPQIIMISIILLQYYLSLACKDDVPCLYCFLICIHSTHFFIVSQKLHWNNAQTNNK